jgi:hypothetical protein
MKQKKGKKKKRGDITRMGGDVERPDIPHYAITDGAVCVCVLLLCFLRFSVWEKVNKFHAVKKKRKKISVENGRINSIVCDFSRAIYQTTPNPRLCKYTRINSGVVCVCNIYRLRTFKSTLGYSTTTKNRGDYSIWKSNRGAIKVGNILLKNKK